MKKVKYNGTLKALVPTLNLEVNPGDVIDVPDDFVNTQFEEVTSKPTSKSSDTKEADK